MSHMNLSELEQVFELALALQAKCKATHVSAAESARFARVNQGLPSALRERMAYLRAKRDAASITDTDYEELPQLTDRMEELHADRMAALVELAKCRSVSLAVLMDQLGSISLTMSERHIPAELRRLIVERGTHCCEYCRTQAQ